jgi:hypothetical protein
MESRSRSRTPGVRLTPLRSEARREALSSSARTAGWGWIPGSPTRGRPGLSDSRAAGAAPETRSSDRFARRTAIPGATTRGSANLDAQRDQPRELEVLMIPHTPPPGAISTTQRSGYRHEPDGRQRPVAGSLKVGEGGRPEEHQAGHEALRRSSSFFEIIVFNRGDFDRRNEDAPRYARALGSDPGPARGARRRRLRGEEGHRQRRQLDDAQRRLSPSNSPSVTHARSPEFPVAASFSNATDDHLRPRPPHPRNRSCRAAESLDPNHRGSLPGRLSCADRNSRH